MVTAAQAYWGDSVVQAVSGNFRCRLPYGAGGARYYALTPSKPGVDVLLPRADYCREGGPLVTVHNRGEDDLRIVKQDGSTVVATVLGGGVGEFYLLDNGTQNGQWLPVVHAPAGVTRGTSLTLGRQPFYLDIQTNGDEGAEVRTILEANGYDGVTPAAVVVAIAPGVYRGGLRRAQGGGVGFAAVNTGPFPAGSTCLIISNGGIIGSGGDGGAGGASGVSNSGQAGFGGGIGLRIETDTTIYNYGTIDGGGGGGGGGEGAPVAGGAGGGGGGGGAGFAASVGGAAAPGGAGGVGGQISIAGGGGQGFAAGGNGGGAGAAGASGSGTAGGAGGAAGPAIAVVTGSTLTKAVAGTIRGSEVVI